MMDNFRSCHVLDRLGSAKLATNCCWAGRRQPKTFALDGLIELNGVMLRARGNLLLARCSEGLRRMIAVAAISGSLAGEGGFYVRRHPSGQGKDWRGRRAGPQDQGGRH